MDRAEEPLFHRLVIVANDRLERRDHVADHIFGRIVQQHHETPARGNAGVDRAGDMFDKQGMLRDGKYVLACRLAVPARDARKPVRDVLDLDIERRRIEQVEPSARQHPLKGAWRRRWLARRHQRFFFCLLSASAAQAS